MSNETNKNKQYENAAIEEWRRQVNNKEGVGAMYRTLFPEGNEQWDKIMEQYIRKFGWAAFAISDSLSSANNEEIKDVIKKEEKKG
jgi:hypothetical protein